MGPDTDAAGTIAAVAEDWGTGEDAMVDSAHAHHAWRPPAGEPPPVEALEGYTDLSVVGRGGESIVYRAREPRLGRDVAVKVLLVDDVESSARFAREIEITVGLGRQHPNIVTVLDTGTTQSGRPAIVMEYYDGGTLNDRLRAHGPFPPDEVVRIGLVLSDALAFAHAQGVLHRDVKPQNVLVLPTSWVLADFGIARLVDAEYTSSVEAFTYRHASPQILDGQPPTPSDDIWSLGSTLYTLLEGRAPFSSDDPDDDSALGYLRRVRTEQHRAFSGDVGALGEVIARCLVKDVGARWHTVHEVHTALLHLRHGAWQPGAGGTLPPAAPRHEPTRPRSAGHDASAVVVEPGSPPASEDADSAAAVVADPPAQVHEHTRVRPLPGDVVDAAQPGDGALPNARGRRKVVVLLGILAVVVGAILGLAGTILRGEDPPDGVAAVAPAETPPTPSADTGSDTGGGVGSEDTVDSFDPALAFRMEDLRQRAGEITVAWTDPSDGVGSFHLAQTSPDARPVQEFGTGATEATFSLAQPPGHTCFVMVVRMPDGSLGRSDQRCLTLR